MSCLRLPVKKAAFTDGSPFLRIKAPFLALKLKFAEYSQNCLLLNLFEDAAYRFFRSSLRSFGIFLFSFGSFLVSVNLVDGLPED